MKITAAFLVTIAIAALVVGCGGDDEEIVPGAGNGASVASGPGLSIAEAMASDLSGPLLVNGFLLIQADEVLFCSALSASSPPGCSGDSLKVEGLDVSKLEHLSSQNGISWTTQMTQLLGEVDGDILSVSQDSIA